MPAEIQVRFADCDMMGHVNNAVYLSYFEQARMHYFNQMVGSEWDWKKQGIILVRNEVDYLKPIFLHDSPKIYVSLVEIGNTSFTLAYDVVVNGESVSEGVSTLVCFDFELNKPVPVYEEMKVGLLKLKNGNK